VLAELPFTSAEDIVAEYKPGVDVSVKGALRTLRGKEVITDGIAVRPRDAGGRVHGAHQLYSSLNLDAVRLHRRGDVRGARRLARRAAIVERRKATRLLAEALAAGFAEQRPLYDALAQLLATDVRDVVQAVTEQTEAERRDLGGKLGLGPPTFARIVKLHGAVAELQLEGSETAIPVRHRDLSPHAALMLGAGMSLRWEPLGPGLTLLKASPALDLEAPEQAAIHPYERPLPSEDARVQLAGALSVEPTLRRPRGVTIGGSQ
jgi:hypothetical protein